MGEYMNPIAHPPKKDGAEAENRKIKQIKTIKYPVDYETQFDEEVNKALATGWYLVKRYTVPSYTTNSHTVLVAELQRYVSHDE